MPLLAIETSTDVTALCLLRPGDDAPVGSAEIPAGRHGRALIPMIQGLLRESGLAPKDLEGILVGAGPGSYTGVRVGVTAAKTMAWAIGCPLVGLDSLEILASGVEGDGPLAVIADAQRQTVYRACFNRTSSGLIRLSDTELLSLTECLVGLPAGARLVGPGLDRLKLPDDPAFPARAVVAPTLAGLADAARRAWASQPRADVWFLEPTYLRSSSAEEKRTALTTP